MKSGRYVRFRRSSRLKRVPDAVLNACDPLVAAMASYSRGQVIFFAAAADDPIVTAHRATGGRAVYTRAGLIMLGEGDRETALLPLDQVPLTFAGRVAFQVENALAAAASAWAVGLPLDELRAGLASFAPDVATTVGRFNMVPYGGSQVLLDHCHNVAALMAILPALEAIPHRRRTVVYSAFGNRRDADLRRQGELLAGGFDRVFLYDHPERAGRAAGEVPALLQSGITAGSRVQEVVLVADPRQAVQQALATLQPDELLVIQTGVTEQTLDEACQRLHLAAPLSIIM